MLDETTTMELERSPLLSLSLELLLAICDEVSSTGCPSLIFLYLIVPTKLRITDLKQLRLTCRALGYMLAAPVLRTLTISAAWVSLKVAVRNLGCLTEAKSITEEATRELKIDNLSSFAYSHLGLKGGRQFQKIWKRAGEDITPKEEGDMRRRIYTAITSLKAVTSLTYVL